MVCKKCEQKLTKLATPDVRKANAINLGEGSVPLRSSKSKFSMNKTNPYMRVCLECKQTVHLKEGKYCQSCAYKKGICAMCGTKILETKLYKQSSK